MKAYVIAAKYAPEMSAAISAAMRQIEFDMKMKALGATENYVETDDSLTGNLIVIVAESDSKPEIVRWGSQIANAESAA